MRPSLRTPSPHFGGRAFIKFFTKVIGTASTLTYNTNPMAIHIKTDGTQVSDVDISTLDKQQKLVGGYIEYVPVAQNMHKLLIVNEEGRLQEVPELNETASLLAGQPIIGDVVLVHIEELDDE